MHAPITSPRTYLAVFVMLVVLLVLSVLATTIEHGAWNLIAGLMIAIVKATLIVLIFMNARHANATTRAYVLAGFVWLVILLVIIMTDYGTRSWPTAVGASHSLTESP